jgi:hypothetical protein
MLNFFADVLVAIYASLQDWVDGVASWHRFFGWLLLFVALSAIFCLFF